MYLMWFGYFLMYKPLRGQLSETRYAKLKIRKMGDKKGAVKT